MTYCDLTSKKKVGVESLRLEHLLRLDIIIVQLFTNHLCKQSIHICLTLSKMILHFPRFRSYILFKCLYFNLVLTHLNPITPWQAGVVTKLVPFYVLQILHGRRFLDGKKFTISFLGLLQVSKLFFCFLIININSKYGSLNGKIVAQQLGFEPRND